MEKVASALIFLTIIPSLSRSVHSVQTSEFQIHTSSPTAKAIQTMQQPVSNPVKCVLLSGFIVLLQRITSSMGINEYAQVIDTIYQKDMPL